MSDDKIRQAIDDVCASIVFSEVLTNVLAGQASKIPEEQKGGRAHQETEMGRLLETARRLGLRDALSILERQWPEYVAATAVVPSPAQQEHERLKAAQRAAQGQ